MKKGNLVRIMSGDFCTRRVKDEELTFSMSDSEQSQKYAEERYGFGTIKDPEGDEHFGIWLSDEELEQRIEHIRQFYKEGMIPWVCPSCGKLWGGQYDVGSMTWFKCHVCGAEWEQINPEEVSKNVEEAKKPQLTVLKN